MPATIDNRTRAQKRLDLVYKKKVKKGLKLLQKKYGDDWVEHIDLEVLDLGNSNYCVLGQLYGPGNDGYYGLGYTNGYSAGLDELSINGHEYGFDQGNYLDFAEYVWDETTMSDHFSKLTELWTCVIKTIRKKKDPVENCLS